MLNVLRRGGAFAPLLVLLAMDAASAAATGVQAIDTARPLLITFVQGLATVGAIFLLGVLVWDFVQHRNIARSIFELLGVVFLGVIAFNAGNVAQFFGVGAAVI